MISHSGRGQIVKGNQASKHRMRSGGGTEHPVVSIRENHIVYVQPPMRIRTQRSCISKIHLPVRCLDIPKEGCVSLIIIKGVLLHRYEGDPPRVIYRVLVIAFTTVSKRSSTTTYFLCALVSSMCVSQFNADNKLST